MLSLRLLLASLFCTLLALPGVAAAQGCQLNGATGDIMLPVADTGRPVLVHVPANARPGMPLLIELHGSGGDGKGQLAYSRMAQTADAHGFIVAVPDAGIPVGKGFVWNIPGVPVVGGKMPPADAPDDAAYLLKVMDAVHAQLCSDSKRVYVAGMSGGGRMTSWMACHAADRIAAAAPVVGLRAGNPDPSDPTQPDPKTCQPTRPVPILAFAGGKDRVNPPAGGGAGYWQYSMETALQRWATLDHCSTRLAKRWIAADAYVDEYGGCAGDSSVGAITFEPAGHQWLPKYNEIMWSFLSRHHLP